MGRGLAAILPGGARTETEAGPALRQSPVELIRPNPDQPRKEFNGESLLALAEAIEAKGVLQPLVVRALPGGTYELIAGERRLRASKIAKLEQVPAIIRDAEGTARLELALVENVAREDLAAGWSVKETEKREKAEQHKLDEPASASRPSGPPADLVDAMAAASDALTAATGHDVRVKATASGVRAEI